MNMEIGLVGLATLISMAASGGAFYVTMKISAAQKDFKIDLGEFKMVLIKDLEDRFMKIKDCVQYENLRKEMDNSYRAAIRKSLEDIQVEVHHDRDDVSVTLKGILAAIKEEAGRKPR